LHRAPIDGLPDGTFLLYGGEPMLVLGGHLLDWSPAGYRAVTPRPACGQASVITPPSLVEVLRRGWQPLVPLVHPSAEALVRSR
jgi:hypothetical protein